VYRAVQTLFGIPVTAIYGSDLGVAGYRDREFGVSFAWDTDLLAGYDAHFLVRTCADAQVEPSAVEVRGLGAILKRLKPRAVMLLGYGSRFDRRALYEAWRAGLPLLFRAETTDHSIARGSARAWVRDNTLRALYRRLARMLYIGQRSLRHYQRLEVPEEKLVFAPYCVEAVPFDCDEVARAKLRGAVRAELGLAANDLALLFAGKISERKGPDLLLQAVRELPHHLRSRMCLCFLGDGRMRASIQSDAAAAPAVRVLFLGFQNQTKLSRYYHAADVLVLPSRWGETWGLVVNEALHHGVPCVVSEAVGCAPDLILPGITGHIFETGSFTSLAVALSDSLGLLGRADTRDRCRQQVSRYSVREAARGVAEAYAQVAR
jgi:glycosyltransferase involved in cell wall biosynthesis